MSTIGSSDIKNSNNVNYCDSTQFPLFSQLPQVLQVSSLAFLDGENLAQAVRVNKFFHSLSADVCKRIAKEKGIVLPERISEIKLLPFIGHIIGVDSCERGLGEVDRRALPPISRQILEKPVRGWALVFHPETFKMKIDKDTPFKLNVQIAVGGRKARLTKDVSVSQEGSLCADNTPQNLLFLAEHSKKGARFLGAAGSFAFAVLDQHGDMGTVAHWSYQDTQPFGAGKSIMMQQPVADSGFEKISFTDRLYYYLMPYLEKGVKPQVGKIESTSTFVEDEFSAWITVLAWSETNEGFQLNLPYFSLVETAMGTARGIL